jgi:hypothetical protein
LPWRQDLGLLGPGARAHVGPAFVHSRPRITTATGAMLSRFWAVVAIERCIAIASA